MPQAHVAPYGTWKSPITSELIVAQNIGLGEIVIDHGNIYWLEARPQEQGRHVLVRCQGDRGLLDLTPAPFNLRTRVHEYGGGAFTVDRGICYFANDADQRLYRQRESATPQPLTVAAAFRFADLQVDRHRDRLICVREDHSQGNQQPINTLVSVPLDPDPAPTPQGGQILVAGNDFYASPRLSPDGTKLAWLTWNHPNLPWDGTELWVATIQPDGSLTQAHCIAGGPEESIFQPQWSPDGILYFVSDRGGWWNLYRYQANQVQPLLPLEAEFGLPQWVFGQSTYGFIDPEQILCTYTQQGLWQLASLDIATGHLHPIATPYTAISGLQVSPTFAVFQASSPTQAPAIAQLDLLSGAIQVLQSSSRINLDPGYLSIPQPLEFSTASGLTAHAFFYPPQNRDYLAPAAEKPPLLVRSHGGPTAAASTALNLKYQYWTSRGFAVLDVNYSGSTGYGRAYQLRLRGQWGILDWQDCVSAAEELVQRGWVDGDRLAISGSSAGGYTTLCALTFSRVFKVGASYYGVSDLEALAHDTHKFESHYFERLIGPYPQRRDLYLARSPIHFTEQLTCPIIFFQGLQDQVVPPDQATHMVEAIAAKGLPVAYIPFANEQHGFRQAENIRRALDSEFYFYAKIFGFEPADPLEPVLIQNLP